MAVILSLRVASRNAPSLYSCPAGRTSGSLPEPDGVQLVIEEVAGRDGPAPHPRAAIESGGLRDLLVHPNQHRYPGQLILVVAYGDYAYLVPSVEESTHYFLKTIIPSRKATREYLERKAPDEEA
jgi:hypothetical protein